VWAVLIARSLAALTAWALLTSAQLGPEPPLQPATYRSPSGEYELFVDPTSRHGEGAGRYRMSYQGEELWSLEHAFTFQKAVVADDGSSAGYACSEGLRGLGELVVAVLGPTGKVRSQESFGRESSRYVHGAPNPRVHGVLHQAEADLLLLRIPDPDSSRGNETWWRYRLSTGERLADLEPKQRMEDPEFARWSQAAEPVPGTVLILSQWSCRNSRRQLDKEIWAGGAILTTGPGPRFELRFATRNERVHFDVVEAPNGWRVKETGREPYAPSEAPAEPEPKIQDVELVELGRVRFGAGPLKDSPVHGVITYDVDDRGRIGVVRRPGEGEDHFTFALLDAVGEERVSFPLEPFTRDPWPAIELCWLESNRWLITHSVSGVPARAFWIEAQASTVERIEAWRSPGVNQLVRGPEGRSFALVTYAGMYTMRSALIAFDESGRKLWEIGELYEDPTKLFSPMDLTVTADGQVVVLQGIRNELQVYEPDGTYATTVSLEAVLGAKPRYPSEVHALPEGGLLVEDQNRYAQLDDKFELVGWIQPHYPDGSTTGPKSLLVDSRGTWWSRDEGAFLELDGSGTVQSFVGPQPDPDALTVVDEVTVDHAGRVYLLDARTGAAHIFECDGTALRICHPEVGDWEDRVSAQWMSVGGDGALFIGGGSGHFVLEFAPDGQRLRRLMDETCRPDWTFVPTSNEHWTHYLDEIELLDVQGELIRRLERTAANEWFEDPIALGVALDGSVVVVDQAGPALHFHDPRGTPLGHVDLPSENVYWDVAFDGSLAMLISDAQELLLVTLDGPSIRRIPTGLQSIAGLFFSPDGAEIWVFPYQEPEMIRFALP